MSKKSIDCGTSNYMKYNAGNPLVRYAISNFLREVKSMVGEGDLPLIDIGCGEGFSLKMMDSRTLSVGVDINLDSLAYARKTSQKSVFCVADINNLPFKDKSFNVCLCLEVLEHLNNPSSAISELKRISKDFLILSVPNNPYYRISNMLRMKNLSRFGEDKDHLNSWSVKGFRKLVETHLNIVDIKTPFPWTLILCET